MRIAQYSGFGKGVDTEGGPIFAPPPTDIPPPTVEEEWRRRQEEATDPRTPIKLGIPQSPLIVPETNSGLGPLALLAGALLFL